MLAAAARLVSRARSAIGLRAMKSPRCPKASASTSTRRAGATDGGNGLGAHIQGNLRLEHPAASAVVSPHERHWRGSRHQDSWRDHLYLDDVQGLRVSISGHDGRWPISTVKFMQS